MLRRMVMFGSRKESQPDIPDIEVEFPVELETGENGEFGAAVYKYIKKLDYGAVATYTIDGSYVAFYNISYDEDDNIIFNEWEFIDETDNSVKPVFAVLTPTGTLMIQYE